MGRQVKRKKKKAIRVHPKPLHPWVFIGLGLLALIPYLNTLGHGLVFDDVTLILQNPQVREFDLWGILYKSGYRPVRTLTYAVNFLVGGSEGFSYHLVNILLHVANTLLLLRLLWLLSRSAVVSVVGALFFAAHPIQTAAVAYVSGRKDLLAALFILIALVSYLAYRRQIGGRGAIVISASSFVLGLLSKEVMIVFPALLILSDCILQSQDKRDGAGGGVPIWQAVAKSFRSSPFLYGGFGLLGVLGLYWALFIAKASRMEGFWGGTLETNIGTSFKLFAHYVKLALFPYPLIADYLGNVFPLSEGFGEPATVLAFFFLITFGGLALWLFGRAPLISCGMLWFLIGIAPVLQFVPFHELAADHFLYVPMIGASLVFGAVFSRLLSRVPSRLAWFSLGSVIVLFCAVVVDRNRDWKDKKSLWEATYSTTPDSYRANANLGQIYFQAGDSQKGIDLTRRALELWPERALPRANLGAMYYTLAQKARQARQFGEAEQLQGQAQKYLTDALELGGFDPFTLSNLGNTYKELGLIYDFQGRRQDAVAARKQAKKTYEEALSTPDRRRAIAAIWMNWGLVFFDEGDYQAALPLLRKFLARFPDDPDGNYWAGVACYRLNQLKRAVYFLERAARRRRTPELLEELADSYRRMGFLGKAAQVYEELVRRAPNAQNYYNLGSLMSIAGETERARQYLRRARELEQIGSSGGQGRKVFQDPAFGQGNR